MIEATEKEQRKKKELSSPHSDSTNNVIATSPACTHCAHSPVCVNLTKTFRQDSNLFNDSSMSVTEETTSTSKIARTKNAEFSLDECKTNDLLYDNLRSFGWSPIQITGLDNDIEAPSSEKIQKLFNDFEKAKTTTTTTSNNSNSTNTTSIGNNVMDKVTYVASESGNGGNTNVEPKESLELLRVHCRLDDFAKNDSGDVHSNNSDATSSQPGIIHQWCLAMSEIAQRVNCALQIPPNTLLVDDDDNDDDSWSLQTDKDKRTQNDQLDLLRVFYYHQVQEREEDSNLPRILGSSPHTDWGSWTVVWQDDVCGLETFCRRCKTWCPVPTPKLQSSQELHTNAKSTSTWNCIVHVGDISSLALSTGNCINKAQKQSADDSQVSVQWPSPRHRVVSPTHKARTSLVYFAYPPVNSSIDSIQKHLLNSWIRKKSMLQSMHLPYEEYYLLRDQSSTYPSTTEEKSENAKAVYEKVRKKPIHNLVAEKWMQVQRK